MDKAPDAFRTISEVAEDLKLPQHVLRFWESRFVQIKPMKRAGGRRYYRPDDVELLRGIHHLLYGEGYTIRGVQRILRDQGIKFVQTVWLAGAEQPLEEPGDDGMEEDEAPIAAQSEKRIPLERASGLAADEGRQQHATQPQARGISAQDLQKLRATLAELSACRELLEAALVQK